MHIFHDTYLREAVCHPVQLKLTLQSHKPSICFTLFQLCKCVPSDSEMAHNRGVLLGQGAFGMVFEGSMRIAIKRVRFDISEKAESELENMRLLHHDNLIKLFSYFTEGGLYLCLVMELADVGSLGDVVIKEANQSESEFFKEQVLWRFLREISAGFVCLFGKIYSHSNINLLE